MRYSEAGNFLRLAIQKLVITGTVLALSYGYAPAKPQKAVSSKATSKSHTKSTASSARNGRRHGKGKVSWKKKGQQGIKPERATEIQQALIREKYLTGEATDAWDARTQAALVKYQGDHGWQTKVVPDSRALIKLGLGPNYSAQSLLSNPSNAPTGGASSTTAASRSATSTPDK